jgi:hypothetical protein
MASKTLIMEKLCLLKRQWCAALLLLLSLLPTQALKAQETVYLPFFEAVGLESTYQYSVTKLYKLYLEETGRYKVVLAEMRDTAAVVESMKAARESAEAMGTSHYVLGELNRMGETVVIAVSLYSTANGSRVWHRMAKAGSPEDIDLVIASLAQVTGTERDIAELATINNVTAKESKELQKKEVVKTHGLLTGAAFPIISDQIDEELAAGIGFIWSFDAENYIFDIKAEGYFSEANDIYFLDINVLYPFNKRNNTPFVLAGMGVSGMNARLPYYSLSPHDPQVIVGHTEFSKGGVIASAGGGYIINRSSNVNLRLTLKGFYAAYDLIVTESVQPFGGIFSVAVLFNR